MLTSKVLIRKKGEGVWVTPWWHNFNLMTYEEKIAEAKRIRAKNEQSREGL